MNSKLHHDIKQENELQNLSIKSCIGSSQNLYQKFKRYRLSVRRNNIAISTINSSAKSTEKKHDILPKYYVFENFNKRLKRQL